MNTIRRKLGSATMVSLAALAIAVPAAHAQNPVPCEGTFLIADAAGDQGYKQQGQTVFPTGANTDVVGLFFRVDAGKVTANVVLDELTKTPPDGFEVVRYRVYFTIDGTVRYLQALVNDDGATYTYGSELAAVYTEDGETTGALFEGKNGVVQIVLPADAGGTPGTELAATSASIGLLTATVPPEAQLPPFYFGVDTAPDGGADGPNTTPAECAPPPSGGTEPPATTPPAGSPGTQPAQAELRLTLARATLKARKANAKRRATFGLKSSEELTNVSAKLMRGAKAVGTGKLAKLGESGTLALKLKGKLKKRTHKLVLAGTRADGSKFTRTFKVRVSR